MDLGGLEDAVAIGGADENPRLAFAGPQIPVVEPHHPGIRAKPGFHRGRCPGTATVSAHLRALDAALAGQSDAASQVWARNQLLPSFWKVDPGPCIQRRHIAPA